ncbi:LysR family transcriptional regulator, partial [Planktomarina temperata]|nr:LysR family transcriptional regulator [Planktomarina temperata]
MSINRTLLAAFHSVANAGSFTAAAHEKSVTQSTLSVQVGQLEKTYGCKLFLRHGRSIALTETGRELYNLTRQQFDAEQEAEALLSGKIRGPTGHLRMGAVSSVLVVEYLKTFLSAFPLSTLALELSNSQKIITDISDGN